MISPSFILTKENSFYFEYLMIDSLAINSVSRRIDLGFDVGFDIFS